MTLYITSLSGAGAGGWACRPGGSGVVVTTSIGTVLQAVVKVNAIHTGIDFRFMKQYRLFMADKDTRLLPVNQSPGKHPDGNPRPDFMIGARALDIGVLRHQNLGAVQH
jgi:hypothetical protein